MHACIAWRSHKIWNSNSHNLDSVISLIQGCEWVAGIWAVVYCRSASVRVVLTFKKKKTQKIPSSLLPIWHWHVHPTSSRPWQCRAAYRSCYEYGSNKWLLFRVLFIGLVLLMCQCCNGSTIRQTRNSAEFNIHHGHRYRVRSPYKENYSNIISSKNALRL